MSLREKIENNLAIWLFGALGTGFLVGAGAYQSVIEIAQLDVVSKSRLDELEARCKPNDASEPSKQVSESSDRGADPAKQQQAQPNQSGSHTDPEKRQAQPSQTKETSVASRELLEELSDVFVSTETEKSEPFVLRFSDALPPFPEQFDLIRPGMKLSEAKAAFPRGELFSSRYSVEIETGPFQDVSFSAGYSRVEDPPIKSVYFFYRSAEAKQLVVSETLRKFGGISHSSQSLGSVLHWPDINGFSLELSDNSYQISLRDEE